MPPLNLLVMPAEAGIQNGRRNNTYPLGARLRGDDERKAVSVVRWVAIPDGRGAP